MRSRLLIGFALALLSWNAVLPGVSAQIPVPQGVIINGLPGCDFTTGGLRASCIPVFIGHLIQLVFSLIGVFFLLNIIFAGYQITIASIQGGDRSKGYNRLTYSIIGFLVAACSFIIMDVVLSVILG